MNQREYPYRSAAYRAPTQMEVQQIARYMERDGKSNQSFMMVWLLFCGGVGIMLLLNAALLSAGRGIGETVVVLLMGLCMCTIALMIVKGLNTKKRQLEEIRCGQFEVLDCRILKISYFQGGGRGTVDVCDMTGVCCMENLMIDGITIDRFRNGEPQKVLLMRHRNKHILLSEYRLGVGAR